MLALSKETVVNAQSEVIQEHNEEVTIEAEIKKCKKCKFTTQTMKVLELHIENDHAYDFQCGECGKKFPFKNQLKLHRREVHEEGTFSCFVCNTSFKTHKELKQHIQKKCKSGSTMASAKIVHKTNEDILKEDEHKCPKCPNITNNQVSLVNHINTKHVVVKEKCVSCGKDFETRKILIKHIVENHTVNGIHVINRHVCKICKVEEHGEAARDGHQCKKPEHTCSYCKMSFYSIEARQNHICESHELKTVDEQLRALKRKNTECRNGSNCYRAMYNRCWFKHSQQVNALPHKGQGQMPIARPQNGHHQGQLHQQAPQQVQEQGPGQVQEQWQRQGRRQGQWQANRPQFYCKWQMRCTKGHSCKFLHIESVFQLRNQASKQQ